LEKKLNKLYKECLKELKSINIDMAECGEITISFSKRNSKRYGCCKQEEPDLSTRYYEKIGRRRYIRYRKYAKHNIEISKWLMDLDDKIIKNTIMHEIIHCFPNCNNHGKEFKAYARVINDELGYNITRLGNVEEDYKKSNMKYDKEETFNYKIVCKKCGQEIYRKRLNKSFVRKYRCGICKGKFEVIKL